MCYHTYIKLQIIQPLNPSLAFIKFDRVEPSNNIQEEQKIIRIIFFFFTVKQIMSNVSRSFCFLINHSVMNLQPNKFDGKSKVQRQQIFFHLI